jgi:sugar phosphate isomerase/epimerase
VHECPFDFLDNYSWNIILENMPKKEKVDNKKATNIFVKSKYGFCLDTTHAYTHSKDEIERLYNLLAPKLKQMHFSAAFRQKEHRKLSTATKSFMKSVKPVLKSNVPLILEINKINWDDKTEVNNEIKFVKELFNK